MSGHEDPATDYERALDAAGADCSTYACWEGGVAYVLNRWGEAVLVCAGHINGQNVVEWMEA